MYKGSILKEKAGRENMGRSVIMLTKNHNESNDLMDREKLDALRMRMIEWERGCPKRIQHFLKVNQFAEAIAMGENADDHTLFIIEALGYIHDIGIRASIDSEGRYTARSQEYYGEIESRKLLTELGFSPEDTDRVSMIVGKHHTYNADIQGLDFRALLEADACVNLYEHESSTEEIRAMLKNVFRTKTGRRICCTMFDIQ